MRIPGGIMKTSERAKRLLKAVTRIAEKEVIETYISWLGKTVGGPERFLSVLGVGCYGEKLETFGNLLSVKINKNHENPAIALRDMAKSAVASACGQMPPEGTTHKVILVPLPSLVAAIGPRKVKKILKNWKGTTMSNDLPYCVYTAWK
jgi:hypothetical protein